MQKKIEMLMNVSEDGQQFLKEEIRIVDSVLADYFAAHGWAKIVGEAAVAATPSDATLNVQNGVIGTKVKEI